MSGIAGILHFDGRPVESGQVEAMTSAMRHRGPDGIRHWRRGHAALGHCMLHTTPESLRETQPLANEDASLVLSMDGRVDNRAELRHALLAKGIRLRDQTDAGLVLHAYETWDEDCLAHIDGDFAFLLWDARRQRVFAARDRIGIKPFHYHWSNGRLAVASDIAGLLLAPGITRDLNPGAITEYLADSPLGNQETFFRDCMRLPAGHRLVADARGIRISRYWCPEDSEPLLLPTYQDYVERLSELLARATAQRLRSHRPIGTLLSGGVDSSAIACFAMSGLQRFSGPALQTYSLVFPGLPCDEQAAILKFLDRMNAAPGQRHLFIGSAPNLDGLEASLARPDMPDSPIGAAYYPLYADAAARGCRIMLGGWGADDWIGGGTGRMTDQTKYGGIAAIPSWLLAQSRSHGRQQAMERLFRHGIRPRLARLMRRSTWLSRARLLRTRGPAWLAPEITELLRRRRLATLAEKPESGSYRKAETLRWLHSGMFANNTVLQEAGCAMHGLEGRYPFHDRSIVEFALATPPEVLRGETRYKQLLHAVLAQTFPATQGHDFADPEGSPIYTAAVFDACYSRMPMTRLTAAGWIDEKAVFTFRRHMESLHRQCNDAELALNVRGLWQLLALERWLQLHSIPSPQGGSS